MSALVLRDAQARVVRALEALRDGDTFLVEGILDDLAHDLWALIEATEATERGGGDR